MSFFHHLKDGNIFDNYIGLTIKKNDFDCDAKSFTLKIVTKNYILDHKNKNNPIIPYNKYNKIQVFNISEVVSLNYNFQYIKYESDTGIFLKIMRL